MNAKQPARAKRMMSKLGFTVVEMSIAMTITGLVTAMALPGILSQEPSRRLNRMVWKLNADMRLARTQAMSEGCVTTLSYDRVNKEFSFWADVDRDGTRDEGEVTTCAMEQGGSYRISTYPSDITSSFLPNGTYELNNDSSSGLVLIMLSAIDAKFFYYLYIRPTGQITVFKYVNYQTA